MFSSFPKERASFEAGHGVPLESPFWGVEHPFLLRGPPRWSLTTRFAWARDSQICYCPHENGLRTPGQGCSAQMVSVPLRVVQGRCCLVPAIPPPAVQPKISSQLLRADLSTPLLLGSCESSGLPAGTGRLGIFFNSAQRKCSTSFFPSFLF